MAKENAPIIEAEQKRLAAALGLTGENALAVTDKETGATVRHAETYVRSDSRGSVFFGVLSEEAKTRQVLFRFPKKGHVTNLVTGRQYGVTDVLDLPFGKGIVYCFQITDVRPELAGIKSDSSGKVSVDFKSPCDTVVLFRVFRPDGTQAQCYTKKVVVNGDRAEITVPFALSDARGTWRVTAKDILGGDVVETAINR
jgi:hypothetical protein